MTSVMWFRRDLRLADNPALLEAAADGAGAPAVRARPAAVGPVRDLPPGLPRDASLRALDASMRAASRSSAATRSGGWCWPPARSAPSRVHVAADFGPYGAARDRAVERALAEHDIELVRTGSPYAVAPGRVTKDDGSPYAVFTPFHQAWTAHGWRAPVGPRRAASAASPSTTRPTSRTAPCPDGLSLPTAGEAAASRRWRTFLDERLADYGTRPRQARRPGHLADERPPQVGRDPPAHDARRPVGPARGRSHDLPRRARLARVLRRRAPPPARDRPRLPAAGVRRDGLRRAGPVVRAVEARPDRLPDRRRRHARAAGDRLDAQPGADDRGELPGQGPPRRVAARCPPLHALAGRRRPGLQPARLAVDGRVRHRRRAVLPRLQPDHPGEEVRPGRQLRTPLGARARRRRTTRTSPSTRSSTTPRSVARHWSGGRGSADDRAAGALPFLRAGVLRQRRLDGRRAGRPGRTATTPDRWR